MEKLDFYQDCADWWISRLFFGVLFGCLLIPTVGFWLVSLNVEFYLTKIFLRNVIRVESWQTSKLQEEVLPWLADTTSWYLWNYLDVNFSTPILFTKYFTDQRYTEIRFLTKKERLLFELTWKGELTYKS